jgi:hypothetical protein
MKPNPTISRSGIAYHDAGTGSGEVDRRKRFMGECLHCVLQMVGTIHGVTVKQKDIEALVEGMKTMPATKEAEGLRRSEAEVSFTWLAVASPGR